MNDGQQERDIRRKILLAAKKLFARNGYDGISVRQICEEAGANVALVSYHFGGKEKMFEELLRTFLPMHRMPELERTYDDPVAGLMLFFAEVTRLRMRDPEIIAILSMETEMRSPRLTVVQQVALPFWNGLRTLLRKGREAGLFQFDSLDLTMLFVFGTMVVYSKSPYLEPIMEQTSFDFDEQVAATARFVLGGLGYGGEIPRWGPDRGNPQDPSF